MLGKRRWLSIALVVALTTLGAGLAAGADSGSEGQFLAKINAERAAAGLGSVSMDGGLQAHARVHTQEMMDSASLYHSSSAELQAAAGSGWQALGENVGRGGSVNGLHSAFMNSVGHCKNVLGGYNKVGIGTGTLDGVMYVTVVFMRKGGSSENAHYVCEGGSPPTTQATTTTTSGSSQTTQAPPTTKANNNGNNNGNNTTTTTAPSTTTTIPPTTTTTLIVGPDKPVTPGNSCVEATKAWWTCHD